MRGDDRRAKFFVGRLSRKRRREIGHLGRADIRSKRTDLFQKRLEIVLLLRRKEENLGVLAARREHALFNGKLPFLAGGRRFKSDVRINAAEAECAHAGPQSGTRFRQPGSA